MTIKSYSRNPDAAIVNRMLGGNDGPICKYCGGLQFVLGHVTTCKLLKIRPSVLQKALDDRKKQVRKDANKQLIFRQERPNTTSKQRFKRKMNTRPRSHGPNERVRFCFTCGMARLHRSGECIGRHA